MDVLGTVPVDPVPVNGVGDASDKGVAPEGTSTPGVALTSGVGGATIAAGPAASGGVCGVLGN